MDIDFTIVSMTTVPHVHKDMFWFGCNALDLGQGIAQGMTIIRIMVQCHRP